MSEPGGLERFADRLHPDVRQAIRSWEADHPLARLRAALAGHTSDKSFLDTYAEAVVAHHLLEQNCTLRFEVPTPHGKACDFEVTANGSVFYLHVKRAETERPGGRRLTISSRLRSLERIERPYVVSVRWREGASDADMQRLVRSASEFIRHARVGDELVVHDDEEREIGGILIVAPWEGPHVSLAIGLPSGFNDEAPRMRKLLRRAYRQFMPRAENVILIASSHLDEHEDFENALLGSHVERWDAFPPRGRRIAHGRAADGFWHEQKYPDSRVCGWFPFAPEARFRDGRLLVRPEAEVDPALEHELQRIFAGGDRA